MSDQAGSRSPPSELLEQQISAFLDGELSPGEAELLIRRLQRDGDLQHSLSRYALIGELMRTPASTRQTFASAGFAARVSAALNVPETPASAIAASGSPPRWRWFKPVAGMSIAAGVAVIAVGVMNLPPSENGQFAAGDGTVAGGTIEEANYIVPEIAVTGPLLPAARLTNYVMSHSEYSSPLGRRNVLSGMLADEAALDDLAVPAGFVPVDGPAQRP